MKTTKTYSGYKLVTYKNKKGGYETYVFNGGIKAIGRYFGRLKKDSISLAEVACDNNEFVAIV